MAEAIRKATWLELFYDLVFVVAIAKAVQKPVDTHVLFRLFNIITFPLKRLVSAF
jgi:low temperature requirement protein LtrA